MPTKKKTCSERLLDSKDFPRVGKITEKISKRWGTGTVVIPAPTEVDELMRKVPKGKLVTINNIREALAKKYNATIACPICTGIFANIAAHAAEEQKQQGKTDTAALWRTLKSDGTLNPKYPYGAEAQKRILEVEGYTIIKKGKHLQVANYQQNLIKL